MNGKDGGVEETNGDWVSWRNHVLIELQRINENIEKLADSDTAIRIDVGRLKLCSAIWGGIAGILAGIFGTIVAMIFMKMI